MPVEEKIDLNDINKKVDGKIKDLLHHPSASQIYDNLIHDDQGKPQTIPQLKEMVENEAYLRDLIFDEVQVHRYTTECDSIAV